MRVRELRAAGLLLLLPALSACAALAGSRQESPRILAALFPTAETSPVSTVADVRLTYGGTDVSLPAAAAFGPPSRFRIDLLDPLDRPVSMIFNDRGRIIHYRPAAKTAAAVELLPDTCGDVDAGAWVAYLLGHGPSPERGGEFRTPWTGGRELLRYEGGFPAERILYAENGALRLRRVEWLCGMDRAMTLELEEGPLTEEGGAFRVFFPHAGLAIELEAVKPLPLEGAGPDFFRPALPPATRWVRWQLTGEGP